MLYKYIYNYKLSQNAVQFDLIYPQAGIKDQGAVAQFTTIEYSTKQ